MANSESVLLGLLQLGSLSAPYCRAAMVVYGLQGRLWYSMLFTVALTFGIRQSYAKKSKRWTYPRPQWPVPGHHMAATPCRLFVWNAYSALKFCTCSRLLEHAASTSMWQDTHKQLWLRIPYDSELLRLFPCQQHSIARCTKCGYEYKDHVRWAGERRKNRDFEKMLERNMADNTRAVDKQRVSSDYRGVAALLGKGSGLEKGSESGGVFSIMGRNKEIVRGSDVGTTCDAGWSWQRGLAVLAEAQRSSLFQLAGIGVSSETARRTFAEIRKTTEKRSKARSKSDKEDGEGGGLRSDRRRRGDDRARDDGDAKIQELGRNLGGLDQMQYVR